MRLERVVLHSRRFCFTSLAILTLSTSPMRAHAACKLAKMAELPVTMSNSRPVITAKINGRDARFVVDSGSSFSMISEATAAQFNLKLTPAPLGLTVKGVGGVVDPWIANVDVFTFAGIPIHNVEFLAGGSLGRSENAGLLGQNFLRIGDVEYDLGKGMIRLMRAKGCENTTLAYWVKPSESYSLMDIEAATPQSAHIAGTALINGEKVRVIFDTGAGTSLLSLKAAERAGVKPDSQGVVDAGYGGGIGRNRIRTYVGPFSSFKIGDEEIRNTRLRFADFGGDDADMLIGADFFLSHRIYVASSQHKLYFTYNGGPVFDLTSRSGNPQDDKAGDEPADAAAYSRRGTAFAARRDFTHAIADLTRACDLDPRNPEYFYQRGIVYRDNNQAELALADFDRTLEFKSDDLSALMARAQLRLRARDISGATADLGAADRAASKEDDIRLFLARGYQDADLLPASIAQYDRWIAAHDGDPRMADALNGRCWARALQGQELAAALSDCNTALKLSAKQSPISASVLNSRGLVRLRLGDYDKAIADYDDALKLVPRSAWSLYGRGVAEMRRKRVPEGQADIAAATAIRAPVADEFKRRGIIP
jgi:tetratricopeptide (TPR) repeat protein/predicted aspartyl protease